MCDENYFVIYNSDGDTIIEEINKATLEKRLNETFYGNQVQFLDLMPKSRNTNYWQGAILIIKGTIVVPKTVTRFEV